MNNKYAARLQRSYNLLHKIEQHVHARSKRYLRRSTPVFFTQQFNFPAASGNLGVTGGLPVNQIVDKYITNNSDNCWLTDISIGVYEYTSADTTTLRWLHTTEIGYSSSRLDLFNTGAENPHWVNSFDFVWNFKLNSTDSWYRQNSSDPLGGCWSTSAGLSGRNNKLVFSAPLKFVSGDSLTVRIKPVYLVNKFNGDVVVSFSGFRTEEMYDGIQNS